MLCLVDLGDLEKGKMFGRKVLMEQLEKEKRKTLYLKASGQLVDHSSEISLISNNNDTQVLFLEKSLVHHLPIDL